MPQWNEIIAAGGMNSCLFLSRIMEPDSYEKQFVCPSPKVWDFNEKRLQWASVVHVEPRCMKIRMLLQKNIHPNNTGDPVRRDQRLTYHFVLCTKVRAFWNEGNGTANYYLFKFPAITYWLLNARISQIIYSKVSQYFEKETETLINLLTKVGSVKFTALISPFLFSKPSQFLKRNSRQTAFTNSLWLDKKMEQNSIQICVWVTRKAGRSWALRNFFR